MFKLLDREEHYIMDIEPLEAIHTEELNGEDFLELKLPHDIDIDKKYRILYKDEYGAWYEFVVEEIEEDRTLGIRSIMAESSFYELLGDYIEDSKAIDTTADVALDKALIPTRFERGIVDNLGINTETFYHISSKAAVNNIAQTWKADINKRIDVIGKKVANRYIDLLSSRGSYKGERFVTNENIETIKRKIHSKQIVTALYGYGKGEEIGEGYGRRINFADVNNGMPYVENTQARDIWGRPDGANGKSHIFSKIDFDDITDKNELLQKTTEKLEELSTPLITYEGEIIGSDARLGDTVALIDKTFTPNLQLKARVIKLEKDLLNPEQTRPTLGNFIPTITNSINKQQEYINQFRDKEGVWDRSQVINTDGTINANFLNNLVQEMNNKMNSLGGYVYMSDEGEGIITYDKPIDQNPTMAIQLLGGSFRIANSKDANNNWNWRAFGDGNGFIADSFIGGVLKGGKVHFDLTNGTLLIGENTEDYTLFFDGTNLKLDGQIQLTDSGKVVAFISGQQLVINSVDVNEGILGNHKMEKHAAGTSFTWVGDN